MNTMTDATHNEILELIAQIVECKATTPAEAAEIIRKHKTRA